MTTPVACTMMASSAWTCWIWPGREIVTASSRATKTQPCDRKIASAALRSQRRDAANRIKGGQLLGDQLRVDEFPWGLRVRRKECLNQGLIIQGRVGLRNRERATPRDMRNRRCGRRNASKCSGATALMLPHEKTAAMQMTASKRLPVGSGEPRGAAWYGPPRSISVGLRPSVFAMIIPARCAETNLPAALPKYAAASSSPARRRSAASWCRMMGSRPRSVRGRNSSSSWMSGASYSRFITWLTRRASRAPGRPAPRNPAPRPCGPAAPGATPAP